jgi:3-deoxy-D-manno-octulosonic-acid transferase
VPITLSHRCWLAAYSLLVLLLSPLTLYHLVWRGLAQRDYFSRWSERFGRYSGAPLERSRWVHAVSVGEVNAAQPLVEAWLREPDAPPLVLTTLTPTGSARAHALFGERVRHAFLPYDLGFAVRGFLGHFRPRQALIVETELWPNLLAAAAGRGVPIAIVNARLSARSLRGYRLLAPLIRRTLGLVRAVLAQSAEDAQRYRALGAPAERVQVTGNLKYDLSLPAGLGAEAQAMRTGWDAARPVWIAASTHAEEEAAVLEAQRTLLARDPRVLLLWAPRHPERFALVRDRVADSGLAWACRSRGELPTAQTGVFVIDSLGELLRFYAAADVAFVGGSLQAVGGHNVLEPAALGLPCVVGPHTFNFADSVQRLREVGALRQIDAPARLAEAVAAWLFDADARRRAGDWARSSLDSERGALARTLGALATLSP